MALILYQRDRCHLCDDALEARYGLRVPVLCDDDSGAELDWPFDAERVRAFCSGA